MRHLETFRDIFSLGNAGHLLFAFNGIFSQDTIVNLAEAVRNEVAALSNPFIGRRAFSVFVEMAQNVMHYSLERNDTGQGRGRFLLMRSGESFLLLTCNIIDPSKMDYLKQRVNEINRMGAPELKSSYLLMRRQKVERSNGGAGLGLLDIARRSGQPLGIGFLTEGEGKLRFYLRSEICK